MTGGFPDLHRWVSKGFWSMNFTPGDPVTRRTSATALSVSPFGFPDASRTRRATVRHAPGVRLRSRISCRAPSSVPCSIEWPGGTVWGRQSVGREARHLGGLDPHGT